MSEIFIRHYIKDVVPHDMRCPHTGAEIRPLFCPACTSDEVHSRYSELNAAYRAGMPLCSDETYDRYEKLCRERFPADKRFWKVGQMLDWLDF